MKKLLIGLIVSLCFIFTAVPVIAAENPFSDVNSNNWFYDSVMYAYENQLFKGTSATTFGPKEGMTRGMFVTVLARLENADAYLYTTQRFKDVDSNHWAYTYVNWAYAHGLTNGIDNTHFGVDRHITREQMSVLFDRYLKYKNENLTSVTENYLYADHSSISNYAISSVTTCQKYGLITGKTDNIFDPKGNSTRAEVAAVFQRLSRALNGERIILYYADTKVPTYDSVTLQFCDETSEFIGDEFHDGYYPGGIEYFYEYNAANLKTYQDYLVEHGFILYYEKYEEYDEGPGGIYYCFYENSDSEFGIWYDAEANLLCISFYS